MLKKRKKINYRSKTEVQVRELASLLSSYFSKPNEDRTPLTYCAPFYDKENKLWFLELKKRNSKQTMQLRIAEKLSDTVIDTIVKGVDSYLKK